MAANRRKTIEYAFPTRITQLATDTTLAASARHDTASFTVYIPETTSRSFLSVRLVATYRTEYAATNTIVGWRMGIKLGAAATADTDRATITGSNTASKNTFDEVDLDVTSYFNTNFGAGTSQTCIGSIAVATTTAANVNSITLKLVITYAFDSTAHTTRIKTIRIPIQSNTVNLPTTQTEVGIDGTPAAPANQIPALDTFLPEAGKVYRQIVLDIAANTNSGAATNYTPYIQIDSAAEVARGLYTETLFGPLVWRDLYDITGAITTNAAHAFKARTDLLGRMALCGAVLVVTYEYDESTTTQIMCEAIVPLTQSESDGQSMTGNTAFSVSVPADANVLIAEVDIQENLPTIAQSGIVFTDARNSVNTLMLISAGSQVFRQYTPSSAGGEIPFIHRADHASGWTVVQGVNRLKVRMYGNSISSRGSLFGYAIINYVATKPSDSDAANHPVNFFGCSFGLTAAQTIDVATGTARVPVLGSPYRLSGAFLAHCIRSTANVNGQFFVEQRTGEWDATGFIVGPPQPTFTVQATHHQLGPFTKAFNKDSFNTGKLDVAVDRRIARYSLTVSHLSSWSWWLTYHQLSFAVVGTVTIDGVAQADGENVTFHDGLTHEKLGEVVIAGGSGAFSGVVLTRENVYAKEGTTGVSASFTPGSPGPWDITSYTVGWGGGGGGTAPTITVVSPTEGAVIGRTAPIALDVVSTSSTFTRIVVTARFGGSATEELVHDGTAFAAAYAGGANSRAVITNGYRYTLTRLGGWRGSSVTLRVVAINEDGLVAIKTVGNPDALYAWQLIDTAGADVTPFIGEEF